MIRFSDSIENKSRLITRRMFILSVAKISVFFALVARLFYLLISENIIYRSLSDKIREYMPGCNYFQMCNLKNFINKRFFHLWICIEKILTEILYDDIHETANEANCFPILSSKFE